MNEKEPIVAAGWVMVSENGQMEVAASKRNERQPQVAGAASEDDAGSLTGKEVVERSL